MKTTAVSLLSLLATAAFVALPAHAAAPLPEDCKTGGFALGCQAYSFRKFTVFEAIEKTAQAGGKTIEFFPKQSLSPEQPDVVFNHNSSDEVIAKVQAKLKQHGITPVAYGVVGLPADEVESRKVFEFAKKLGLVSITSEPAPEALDTIEKLVKEYDIKVGIHNHPKKEKDPNYKVWDPNYVLSLVKDRDKRIGSCADTGHWVRSGLKPVECLKILDGRIISSHLKDLNEFGVREAHDLPYGQGVSDIKGILNEFRRQGFVGPISIEYEYNWDNSVPDIKLCVDFVRASGAGK